MGAISRIFNYNNIGGKIKGFVKWYCWISILLIWIIAPITFLFLAADTDEFRIRLCWIALLIALVGPVVIWLSSWLLYAFGELVEDIHAMRNETEAEVQTRRAIEKEVIQEKEKIETEAVENENQHDEFECLSCKKTFTVSADEDTATCPYCNAKYKVY